MIADLHAHYPMHVLEQRAREKLTLWRLLRAPLGRARARDRFRALLVGLASRFANYRSFWSGPRVTMQSLQDGDVRVVLSVLYSFFDELELGERYPAAPKAAYLTTLLRQLKIVADDVEEKHRGEAVIARNFGDLERAVAEDKVALLHCVEGGFHLGGTPQEVDHAVTELGRRGVVYITLAHLVWRHVATNANAFPFMPDWLYRRVFPQPDDGLSELGVAAVEAMAREGVLIDLSHMSERAFHETLDLLERIDPGGRVPVIASHACFRFRNQEYGLSERLLRRLVDRDGVVGLIMAQHQLNDGLRHTPTFRLGQSLKVIARHIDAIREIAGSHRHVAIGSDFDGFIKPTTGGLETMADMKDLEGALCDHYGDEDGGRICSGNALRVLKSAWGVKRPVRASSE